MEGLTEKYSEAFGMQLVEGLAQLLPGDFSEAPVHTILDDV